MANVVDEILEELSRTSEPGVAGPVLVCGVGPFGRRCLLDLSRRISELSADWSRVRFLEVRRGSGHGLESDRIASWTTGSQAKTRLQLSRSMRKRDGELRTLIAKQLAESLEAGAFSWSGARDVMFVVVGDPTDLFTSVAVLEVARLGREVLSEVASGFGGGITGVFALPDGTDEHGDRLFAFLDDLTSGWLAPQAGATAMGPAAVESRLFDRVAVVGRSNPSVTLDDNNRVEMVSELLLLLMHPESRMSVEQVLQRQVDSRLITFGVSTIFYPAKQLVERNARRFVSQLAKSTLMSVGDDLSQPVITEFAAHNGLDTESLYRRILGARFGGSLLDEMSVGALYFKGVDKRYWPDRIASYDAYLQSQRTGRELARAEENLAGLESGVESTIHRKIDELVESGTSLDYVRMFLALVGERIEDIYLEATRKKEETLKSIPALSEKHHELVNRIQNLPRRVAMAGRLLMLAPLLYFVGMTGRAVVSALPSRLLNQAFVPSAFWAQVVLIAVIPVVFWLSYLRAENRVLTSRQAYLEAVQERSGYVVDFWSRRAVVWLSDPEENEQLARRGLRGLRSVVKAEMADVDGLRKRYHRVITGMGEGENDLGAMGSDVRVSAVDVFGLDANPPYKRGSFVAEDEVATFLASGGHKGWRHIDSDAELEERWLRFVAAGYSYVMAGTLWQQVSSAVSQPVCRQAVLALRERSHPFLFIEPEMPAADELATLPADSATGACVLPAKAMSVPWYDPHQLSYLQVCSGFKLSDVRAVRAWQRAYEKAPDKDELHWAGWQVIDWPVAGEA